MTQRRSVPKRRVASKPMFDKIEMYAQVSGERYLEREKHWQGRSWRKQVIAWAEAKAVESMRGGNFRLAAELLIDQGFPLIAKELLTGVKVRGKKGRVPLAIHDRSAAVRAAAEVQPLQALILKWYPAIGEREAQRLAIKFAVWDANFEAEYGNHVDSGVVDEETVRKRYYEIRRRNSLST